MSTPDSTHRLVISCADRPGIVAAVSRFLFDAGANIVSSNVHLWPFVEEARRRGAKLVTIDPFRSRTAEKSDRHLALRPGTDAALALGMLHVIFRDGLEDADYLARFTIGADRLRERAREWTLERAAAITGLETFRARPEDMP